MELLLVLLLWFPTTCNPNISFERHAFFVPKYEQFGADCLHYTMGNNTIADLAGITHKVDFSRLNPNRDSQLRDYQIENKKKIYEAWQLHKSVMLQMPTGTGKTRLFVSIVRDLHYWGASHKQAVKILILAHRQELIEQISETLGYTYNQAHGIIMSNNVEHKKLPVQVGSVPTLIRRMTRWEDKEFDIIIIDEAHHVKADSYKRIIKQYPNARLLGVTATPYRLNGAGFHPEFEKLITSWPISQFIQKGYLCDYLYYSIRPDSDLQSEINTMKIDRYDGDYLDSEMMHVMDRGEIRAKIVNTYIKFAKGEKGIVYTVNKEHNRHLKEQFIANGIKAEVVDSDTPKDERNRIVEHFRKGEVDVLCNVNIFSEGFDCPDIEFIQLARPTKSLAMYLQQVGRGLRPAKNKGNVIILDNVGLYNKFGFPSTRRKWQYHFDGQEVEDENPNIKYNIFDKDEREREVLPIEEGDETVWLLRKPAETIEPIVDTNNDDMPVEDILIAPPLDDDTTTINPTPYPSDVLPEIPDTTFDEASLKLEELNKTIEQTRALGIPIPEDWFELIEKYKQILNPTNIIEQRINHTFREYGDYRVDFAFDSVSKKSLTQEKEQLDAAKIAKQEQIKEMTEIVKRLGALNLTIPSDFETKIKECQQNIEDYDIKTMMLNDIEAELIKLSKQYSIRVFFANNHLSIDRATKGAANSEDYSDVAKTTKRPRMRLKIILPDGRIINSNTAAETMTKFVKFVGTQRVRSLGLMCCGIELVSDKLHRIYSERQQYLGNGLYLLTQSNTPTKIRQIQQIANAFNLDIKIETK